jgi:transcriptional regulator with XRE-family HTH domain
VTFANYVRNARVARGQTLQECATSARVHVSHLSHLENGLLPSLGLIPRLAKALDRPPEELAVVAVREHEIHRAGAHVPSLGKPAPAGSEATCGAVVADRGEAGR